MLSKIALALIASSVSAAERWGGRPRFSSHSGHGLHGGYNGHHGLRRGFTGLGKQQYGHQGNFHVAQKGHGHSTRRHGGYGGHAVRRHGGHGSGYGARSHGHGARSHGHGVRSHGYGSRHGGYGGVHGGRRSSSFG